MSERARAALRALVAEWRRPLDGARQRANTSEDFADIHSHETLYTDCADALSKITSNEPLWSEPLVERVAHDFTQADASAGVEWWMQTCGYWYDQAQEAYRWRDLNAKTIEILERELTEARATRAQVVASLAEDEALVERIKTALNIDDDPKWMRKHFRAVLAAPADTGGTE